MSNETETKLRMTSLEGLGQAAECLKTIAHPHRLRMVQLLLGGEYTVTSLPFATFQHTWLRNIWAR